MLSWLQPLSEPWDLSQSLLQQQGFGHDYHPHFDSAQ